MSAVRLDQPPHRVARRTEHIRARSNPTVHAPPAFIWPADHAWCIANDVDPHWAGIGASVAAIDELLVDPRLDIVRDDPNQEQPYYL